MNTGRKTLKADNRQKENKAHNTKAEKGVKSQFVVWDIVGKLLT